MPLMVNALTAAFLSATVAVAAAQSKSPRQTPRAPDPCASRSTQLDFTQCAEKTLSREDAVLAKVYAALVKDLDDQHRPVLQKAQKAWESFRGAECELQASENLGGSMYAQVYDDCRAAMANSRVVDLQRVRKDLADFIR
jgi:uncharacterized protein YecT (DUF1311 family)